MAESGSDLVGRHEEVGALDRALSRVERGAPRALALRGEPGIGKTRLLAELAHRARTRGFAVMEGRAAELERDLTFALLADALEPLAENGRLAEAAADQPPAVPLDDVHWADPASADVLALLLHRPPAARVLLAVALRSNRAPALEAVLAAAEQRGTAEIVEVGPLPADAITEARA